MAVITCPGYITFAQAVALGLTDAISYTAETDGESIEERLASGLPDGLDESKGASTSYFEGPSMPSGTILSRWYELGWHGVVSTPLSSDEYTFKVNFGSDVSLCKVNTTGLVALAASPCLIAEGENWHMTDLWRTGLGSGGDWDVIIDYIKYCQSKDLATNLTKSGTVTLTGNQTADIAVGDKILISGQGYADDGSGTFTGTPSALIERPDHIFKHFLYTQAAWPVADFSTDAATPFAADSYKFAVVINERKRLKEWLAYMALQCRCWFRFASGKAYLLYRPDSLSSDKTIIKFADNDDNTTTMKIARSPLDEIINKINLHYQRDWSKSAGAEAYQAVASDSNSASITAYGEKEKPETFLFDFIRDAAMASDLAAFYLALYKDRKRVVTGEIFLDNVELEFADAATLTEAGGALCEVRKVGIAPGSATVNDKIILTAREY
jgi:hypothetical protein